MTCQIGHDGEFCSGCDLYEDGMYACYKWNCTDIMVVGNDTSTGNTCDGPVLYPPIVGNGHCNIPACNICGEGNNLTNPDNIFEAGGYQVTCQAIYLYGISGFLPDCQYYAGLFAPICCDAAIEPCSLCPDGGSLTDPDKILPGGGEDTISTCGELETAAMMISSKPDLCMQLQTWVALFCGCMDSPPDQTPAPVAESTPAPVAELTPALIAEPTISAVPSVLSNRVPTVTPVNPIPTAVLLSSSNPSQSPTNAPITAPTTSPTWGSLRIGDVMCVEGYIMDLFCIELGMLLDNVGIITLEGPEEHSVHCLVDVGWCVNSEFEVLVEPVFASSTYRRGWRMSEETKPLVVTIARSVGKECSTCTGEGDLQKGFRAALKVEFLKEASNGIPPMVKVLEAEHSNGIYNPCQSFFGMDEQEPII